MREQDCRHRRWWSPRAGNGSEGGEKGSRLKRHVEGKTPERLTDGEGGGVRDENPS